MPGRLSSSSGDALVYKGQRLTLTQPFLIGRSSDSDLQIPDPEVSRLHAMVFLQGTDWWLCDLGSRNGVRVNGIRLTHARRLRDGDEVRIGKSQIRFTSTATGARCETGRFEEITELSDPCAQAAAPGPLVCELIVATVEGEILEGDTVAQWFFGKRLERAVGVERSLLPPAVRLWLGRQAADGKSGGSPLELHEADRRVVVTLGRCKQGRYFLLVREESQQVVTDQLQALGLTAREAEVMHWVCEGKTNPEIATILSITVHTANRHMEHIFTKLGVDNRQRAIVTVMERLGAV